uniref:ATP synthase complex subunit 8 n=1 Tax=Cyphochilus crataceus TaxID=1453293 RepID=A0AAU8L174_9SCAR
MPQMSPLSWLSLFMVFSSTLVLFNSMNYFSITYPIKTTLVKQSKMLINWKW